VVAVRSIRLPNCRTAQRQEFGWLQNFIIATRHDVSLGLVASWEFGLPTLRQDVMSTLVILPVYKHVAPFHGPVVPTRMLKHIVCVPELHFRPRIGTPNRLLRRARVKVPARTRYPYQSSAFGRITPDGAARVWPPISILLPMANPASSYQRPI
jgi:hypothetical protein